MLAANLQEINSGIGPGDKVVSDPLVMHNAVEQ